MNLKRLCLNTLNMILPHRGKREQYIHLKLGLLIQASGLEASEMATDYKYGLMGLGMMASGRIIELMAMENSYM